MIQFLIVIAVIGVMLVAVGAATRVIDRDADKNDAAQD